jgi:hypothetical protein
VRDDDERDMTMADDENERTDTGAESTSDAPEDPGAQAQPDAGAEAQPDAGAEAQPDAGAEAQGGESDALREDGATGAPEPAAEAQGGESDALREDGATGAPEPAAAGEADAKPSDEGGEAPASERPAVDVSAGGDRIRSGNIVVAGKHFADWFNQDFRPPFGQETHPQFVVWDKHPKKFPVPVDKERFSRVFDSCERIYRKELTLPEFLGLFCVIYNETGGTFEPVSERGSLRYFFMYNTRSMNRRAGQLLLGRRQISDPADVAAWDGSNYPDPTDKALEDAARECDFYKYRGRGLAQVTFRDGFRRYVDPHLSGKYGKTCEDLPEAELGEIIRTDPDVYLPMVKSLFTDRTWLGASFPRVNDDPPDWHTTGEKISHSKDYGGFYAWRCLTLQAAMNDAGWQAD